MFPAFFFHFLHLIDLLSRETPQKADDDSFAVDVSWSLVEHITITNAEK